MHVMEYKLQHKAVRVRLIWPHMCQKIFAFMGDLNLFATIYIMCYEIQLNISWGEPELRVWGTLMKKLGAPVQQKVTLELCNIQYVSELRSVKWHKMQILM